MYHTSVLLDESVNLLNVTPNGIFVDVTFGGGGHSAKIWEKLDKQQGRLIAFDQDPDAKRHAFAHEHFTLVESNFRYLRNFLRYHEALPVDGILADLGISSHQIDTTERGFSFSNDFALDMRMDPSLPLSAKDIIASYEAEKLASIFREYGDLSASRQIAFEIAKRRQQETIKTTFQLREVLRKFAPRGRENSFFAQVFQSLRIEVNDEASALKDFLMQTYDSLKPGGRLVVIAYHSLEDRMVKNLFRSGNTEGTTVKDLYGNFPQYWEIVTKKPIVPSEQETSSNPRSRSAKLRVATKI